MTSDTNAVPNHRVPEPSPEPIPKLGSELKDDASPGDELPPAHDPDEVVAAGRPTSAGPSTAKITATVIGIALPVLGLLLWWSTHQGTEAVWLPAARIAGRVGAVVTVGLFLVLWLLPEENRKVLGPRGTQLVMRWATCATVVWSGSAMLELLLRYQFATGTPIWSDVTQAGTFLLGSGEGTPLHTAHVVLTLGLLVLALRPPSTRAVSRFLALAVVAIGTLPFVLVYPLEGNIVLPPSAALGDAFHVLGALLWTGGLIGLVVVFVLVNRARTLPPSAANEDMAEWEPSKRQMLHSVTQAVDHYSLLALIAALVVTVTGVLMAEATIGSWWPFQPLREGVSSTYLRLVGLKVAGTFALLGAGYVHRTKTMTRLRRNDRTAFVRLAVGEVALMLAVMSLGVLLGFAH